MSKVDKNTASLSPDQIHEYVARGMRLWLVMSGVCFIIAMVAGFVAGCSRLVVTSGFGVLAYLLAATFARGVLRISLRQPGISLPLLGFGLAIATHAPISLVGILLVGRGYSDALMTHGCGFLYFVWSLFLAGTAWGVTMGFRRRKLWRTTAQK